MCDLVNTNIIFITWATLAMMLPWKDWTGCTEIINASVSQLRPDGVASACGGTRCFSRPPHPCTLLQSADRLSLRDINHKEMSHLLELLYGWHDHDNIDKIVMAFTFDTINLLGFLYYLSATVIKGRKYLFKYKYVLERW